MPAPQRRPATAGIAPLLTKAPAKSHPAAPSPSSLGNPPVRGNSEPNRMLCARIPLGLHDEVKILAARQRSSVQTIVTQALEAYLAGLVDAT